jgi:hypothetical protein
VFTLFISCEKEAVLLSPNQDSELQSNTREEPFPSISFAKKHIPFSVQNMTRAYESLLTNKYAKYSSGAGTEGTKSGTDDYEINTTHYYYKFLPSNESEYDQLINDTVLNVSTVPFEYYLSESPVEDIDPEFQEDNFFLNPLYSVFPVDYNFPTEINSEFIVNLHFTGEDEIRDDAPPSELQMIDFFHDLNLETRRLTGSLTNEEKSELTYISVDENGLDSKFTFAELLASGLNLNDVIIDFSEIETFEKRRRWTPSGRITLEEDALSEDLCPDCGNTKFGVNKAVVVVRKWGFLTIRRAVTDFDGNFQTNSTKTKNVRYSLFFEHPIFRFRVMARSVFIRARHRGDRSFSREEWVQHFTPGMRAHFYGLIHNAAIDYVDIYTQKENFKLFPPQIGLKITGNFNNLSDPSHYRPLALLDVPGLPDIGISRGRRNRPSNSVFIYGAVIHEIAHAGHHNKDFGIFHNLRLDGNGNERWVMAEGCQTMVTNDRYNQWSVADWVKK